MKYQTISFLYFFALKGAIYDVAIKKFTCAKISCFRAKAHLVFHLCQ